MAQKSPEEFEYISIHNPKLLEYYKDVDDDITRRIIFANPMSIYYIKNQTERMCNYAMLQTFDNKVDIFLGCKKLSIHNCHLWLATLLHYQDERTKLSIFNHIKQYYQFTDNIIDLFILTSNYGSLFRMTNFNLSAIQMRHLVGNTSGIAIRDIAEQTEELCDYAIACSMDGHVIQFIKNQTKKQINDAILMYRRYIVFMSTYKGVDQNYPSRYKVPYMEQLIKDNKENLII
jgi:hypothetical protein